MNDLSYIYATTFNMIDVVEETFLFSKSNLLYSSGLFTELFINHIHCIFLRLFQWRRVFHRLENRVKRVASDIYWLLLRPVPHSHYYYCTHSVRLIFRDMLLQNEDKIAAEFNEIQQNNYLWKFLNACNKFKR